MQDRIPQFPNRYKILTDGGEEFFVTILRNDDATQNGTPLNKSTLLSDETAILYGLQENSVSVTPDFLFKLLYQKINWQKIAETTAEGGETSVEVALPNDVLKYSEIVFLLFGGEDEYISPSYSVDLNLNTTDGRTITVAENFYLQGSEVGTEKLYRKAPSVEIFNLGNEYGVFTQSQNQPSGNVLASGTSISSVEIQVRNDGQFYQNAKILIFGKQG